MQSINQTQAAIAKYQVAINKNISESEILWNRYNALLVFNSILITAIGFSYQGNLNLPLLVVASLPIAGLLSCYLWFIVTLRGFQWIKFWTVTARKIEEKYLPDDNPILNPINNGKNHREDVVGWPKTQIASYILILVTAILYLIFLANLLNTKSFHKNIFHSQQRTMHRYIK
ncbi:MAG TPA: hypothetical protein VMR81_07880 [Patescibacteria group bacterium]|nr:hypothetical protein [Patescibacteria group bacterium]